MMLEYNPEEEELFDQIVDQVAIILESYYEHSVNIKIGERLRKFNFSTTINKIYQLHVRTFFYAVEDGEKKYWPWKDAVLDSTKAIYELNRVDNLGLPIPELVALDYKLGIIITKIVRGRGLHEVLLGNSRDQAVNGLMSMAKALAQFHGITIGKTENLQNILTELGSEINKIQWIRSQKANIAELSQLLQKHVTTLNHDEIENLMTNLKQIKLLVAESKLKSMINADLCPDNLILDYNGDKVEKLTMIDLDTFTFYNPFIDVYYIWVRASCWCVGKIEDKVVREMENEYLAEIRKYIKMTKTEFYVNLFLAGLVWTIIHLSESFIETETGINLRREFELGRGTMGQRFYTRLTLLENNFRRLEKIIADHKHYKIIKRSIEALSAILKEFSDSEKLSPLTNYQAFD